MQFPTTQLSTADLAGALKESKVHQTPDQGNKGYLKFKARDNEWIYGKDGEEVTDETIIVNTFSMQHGWMLWPEKEPMQKTFVPFTKDLPPPMPSITEEIKGKEVVVEPAEARYFEARFMDDEAIVVFESNSYGSRKGYDNLLKEIIGRANNGENKYLFPVVQLSSDDGYKHSKGYYYNPVLKITSWADIDGNLEPDIKAIEQDPELEEAPVRKRRRRRA